MRLKIKFCSLILVSNLFTCSLYAQSDFEGLLGYGDAIFFTTNHNSTKISNVIFETLITGSSSKMINFLNENTYLENEYYKNKFETSDFESIIKNTMNIELRNCNSEIRNNFFNVVIDGKIELSGIDCNDASEEVCNFLITKTTKYFIAKNFDLSLLKSVQPIVEKIPGYWHYAVTIDTDNYNKFSKFISFISSNVDDEGLRKSWLSVNDLFQWIKNRPISLIYENESCLGRAKVHAYRDSIMFINFLSEISLVKRNIAWMGSGHSERNGPYNKNISYDNLKYPKSFGDYFNASTFSNRFIKVLFTEEKIKKLRNVSKKTFIIGGQKISVYFKTDNEPTQPFSLTVHCDIQKKIKVAWFDYFNYIVCTE